MKFFHISDLHIGKRVNGFSMLEDQRYILRQILDLAQERRPDGVLIAGDMYDKSLPSAEAVELVDWFLSQWALLGIPVWAISGNHDSAERVAYGGRMLEQAGVHVSRVFDGTLQGYCVQREMSSENQEDSARKEERRALHVVPVTYTEHAEMAMPKGSSPEKDYEKVYIWLLPYLRPAQVRRFYEERTIETTQQAVDAVLDTVNLPKDGANILLMHQFLAGAAVCDSEELSVGGLDQVEASVVDAFDYVALGHLHRPQKVGRETVRYCGSPLKYSFSEANHQKSVTEVEILSGHGVRKEENLLGDATYQEERVPDGGKHEEEISVKITTLPLMPRLDLREVKGPMETLLQKEVYSMANREDYLHITLTDQEEILDAIGKLREVYPNIMRLDFAWEQADYKIEESEILVEEKTPQELFEEFFLLQNGREMSEEQRALAASVLQKAVGES